MQKSTADVLEAAPRCDGAQVLEPTGLLEQVPGPGERRLQECGARHGPDVAGVCQEPSPVLTRRATERRVERRHSALAVVRHVELGPVREAIVGNGIHLDEIDALLERGAGLEEGVAPHRGQGQQRWPRVEHEAVALVPADLAAEVWRLLADDDLVALHRKPRGHGQPAHAGSDHDNPAHTCRPFHVSEPSRCLRAESAMSATNASTEPGVRRHPATPGCRSAVLRGHAR